jgi:hypothetical protein
MTFLYGGAGAMGIGKTDLELLIKLRQQGQIPLNPYVVELGAQQLSNSFLRATNLVRKAEAEFGVSQPYALPGPVASSTSDSGGELLASTAPFARDFWVALGFEYTAIDVDGSPGSIPLDLNYDQVPQDLRGKYGLLTNLGTTEHVCNQMNAFKVIHDLAAPGGVMIHHLPAGGLLNHGLVNYNPKFFWYLARSNDYEWLYMRYYGAGKNYPIAANIINFTQSYAPEWSETLRDREISDYVIIVALRKTLDIPFVAPIDINTGTQSSDRTFNRRYWTVLQPALLEVARRSDRPYELGTLIAQDERIPLAQGETTTSTIGGTSHPVAQTASTDPLRVGRRYVALVAGVSAASTAVIMAALLIAARLLFF